MIQIIKEKKKPSLGQQFAQAFGNMGRELPNMIGEYQQNQEKQEKMQNEKSALEKLGMDPNLPPELQKLMMQYELMGGLEEKKGQNKLDQLNYKNDLRKKLIEEITGGFSNQSKNSDQEQNYDAYLDEYVSHERQMNQKSDEDFFSQAEKYAAIGEHDLSQVATNRAKANIASKNAQTKEVRESYKENKPFIDRTYDQYEDSLRKEAILDRMSDLDDETSQSGITNLLETLGLKQEWIQNPANEEYTKLGLDLLGGGTLQADYGSRVLASEFKVSQQRIPTLMQTKEGRKQISENLKTMLLPARLKEERMKYYLDKSERTGQPLPHDLRGKILKDIRPELEEAYDKFKQRNGRYKVRNGTIPDDQSIEKYYFLSDGNEKKAFKMMKEDGYDID